MDLLSVACFLRVAETLHFGRAALDLHLSQPALSQRIATLEREAGTRLLDRNRRAVRLTAAGQAFLGPARAAVAHGEQAVDLARRAARGETGRLRLGFTVIASYTWLPRVVQDYRRLRPEVVVELTECNSPAVEDALVDGTIDVGVLHPPLERPGLPTRDLPAEPLVLAVPDDHRLAGQPALTFADLDEEPLLTAPRKVGPALFDRLLLSFEQAGAQPRIVQEATPMTTLAGLVAAGAGVGFVTRGIAAATRPGVVFRDVAGAPAVPLATVWPADGPVPTAADFLDLVAAAATEDHPAAANTGG